MEIESLLPAFIGLGGVLIGAIATTCGTIVVELIKSRRERKALALALKAEVSAMLEIETQHRYRNMYQSVLDTYKARKVCDMPDISYETNPARSVYYSNLSKIGLLKAEAAQDMVQLSYMWEVIAADRQCMESGEWHFPSLERRIEVLSRHLEIYDETVTHAENLIKKLN